MVHSGRSNQHWQDKQGSLLLWAPAPAHSTCLESPLFSTGQKGVPSGSSTPPPLYGVAYVQNTRPTHHAERFVENTIASMRCLPRSLTLSLLMPLYSDVSPCTTFVQQSCNYYRITIQYDHAVTHADATKSAKCTPMIQAKRATTQRR